MVKNRLWILLLLLGLLSADTELIAGGPENAIIVVNEESDSSKLIANHYIALRKIPAVNVIYLRGIPTGDFIKLEECRNKVLLPIFKTIEQRGLTNHIDYVIYSSGFPTSVKGYEVREELKATGDAKAIQLAKNKFFAPELSLTSATYLYQSVLAEDHFFYLSLNSNLYMRTSTQKALTQPFVERDQVLFDRALKAAGENDYAEATKILESLAEKHPQQMAVLYWLARIYSMDEQEENSIKWLKRAIAAGWSFREYTFSDPSFSSLLENEDFQDTLEFIPDLPFRHLGTQSFRSEYFWGPNGSINSTPNQGARYVLSTMLGVNQNQGITEQETLDYLRRSIKADGTFPEGTFYFCGYRKNSDQYSASWIRRCDPGIGVVRVSRPRLSVLCFRKTTGRGWINDGLRRVQLEFQRQQNLTGCDLREPYQLWWAADAWDQTDQTERISEGRCRRIVRNCQGTFRYSGEISCARLQVHYARGCTLAESFYQSVSGPFQLLIVGDALCKPWASIPEIEVTGDLVGTQPASGTITFEIDGKNSVIPIAATDIFVDGILKQHLKRTGRGPVSINTNSLADGYHELRIVPIAAGTIATHGSQIFPLEVDNHGHQIKLTTKSADFEIADQIEVTATAPLASEIQLIHNGRIMGRQSGEDVKFKVQAKEFGRGPVEIFAVATVDGKSAISQPVNININGPIATNLPIVEEPLPSR